MNHHDTRSYVTYTATPDAVGYGFPWNANETSGRTATLLVKPGVDHDTLAASLAKLAIFIAHDENHGARSAAGPFGSPGAGDPGSSIAISWDPRMSSAALGEHAFSQAWATDVQDTKRHGPWFNGRPDGCVALVIDADLGPADACHALNELAAYAIGAGSDFLEPVPVKRVVHHLGEIQGYTHDGMPVRGMGSTSIG